MFKEFQMILITTFGKEEVCDATTNSYNKGGSAGFFNQLSLPQSIHSCRASLTQNLKLNGGI